MNKLDNLTRDEIAALDYTWSLLHAEEKKQLQQLKADPPLHRVKEVKKVQLAGRLVKSLIQVANAEYTKWLLNNHEKA